MDKLTCRQAFTLAEVLVTLGIIGVISALTLPTLMKNHQRQVFATQIRAVYSLLSQGVENKLLDSNAINLREARFFGNEGAFLKSYFKIAKDCGTTDTSCFASTYDVLNSDSIDQPNNLYKVVLANGASVGLSVNGISSTYVWIDANGTQGPNMACRDLFDLTIQNDGTLESSWCLGQLMKNGWVMDEHYDSVATW